MSGGIENEEAAKRENDPQLKLPVAQIADKVLAGNFDQIPVTEKRTVRYYSDACNL
jgi:hypothetical protein